MVNDRIVVDFELILGVVYVSFGGQMLKDSFSCWACFRSFFYRFLTRNFDAWDFQIEVFALKVFQNSIIVEVFCHEFLSRVLLLF